MLREKERKKNKKSTEPMLDVSLRKVVRKDWDFIMKIRNKKEFRSSFYDQHTITKEEHYKYLRRQKSNPNFVNWIICYGEKNVGYVRILENDISIMINKEYNSRGIGTKALRLVELEAKKLGMKKLIGRVMIHNKGSQRIFKKNKYKLLMYWYEKQLSSR